MNLLLLIGLLSITLLVVLSANGYDLLSPGALYCVVFILGAVGLLVLGDGLTIRLNTVGIIWACSLAFALGDIVAFSLSSRRAFGAESTEGALVAESSQAAVIDIRIIIALCFLMIGTTLYTAYDLGSSATAANFLSEGAMVSHGVEKSTLSSLLNGLTTAIAYGLLCVVLFQVLYKWRISHGAILVILLYMPILIITGSRIQLLYFVVVGINIFYSLLRKKTGFNKSSFFKFLKIAVPLFLLILVGFYLLGLLTGKSQAFRIADIVLVYLGAPLSGFDQCVNGYYDQVINQGLFSFSSISNVLLLFGITVGKPVFGHAVGGSAYGFYAIVPERGLYGNVYTGLFAWIHDAGFLGSLLICFVISVGFGLVRCRIARFKAGSIAPLACFSVYYIPLFFMAIDDLFDDDLSYKKLLVAFVAYLVVKAYESGKLDLRSKRNSPMGRVKSVCHYESEASSNG